MKVICPLLLKVICLLIFIAPHLTLTAQTYGYQSGNIYTGEVLSYKNSHKLYLSECTLRDNRIDSLISEYIKEILNKSEYNPETNLIWIYATNAQADLQPYVSITILRDNNNESRKNLLNIIFSETGLNHYYCILDGIEVGISTTNPGYFLIPKKNGTKRCFESDKGSNRYATIIFQSFVETENGWETSP